MGGHELSGGLLQGYGYWVRLCVRQDSRRREERRVEDGRPLTTELRIQLIRAGAALSISVVADRFGFQYA